MSDCVKFGAREKEWAMNLSRTLRATIFLLFLMLTTGCYKSVKSNENEADSDSDSSETDDIE